MKISFVIPAYNESAEIVPCLTSLTKEIERAKKLGLGFETEIIVANNASTDTTRELALSIPGVQVVDELRKGANIARQTGFEASTGSIVASIDADTRVPEGWLSTIIREFTADPTLIALTGPHIYYDTSLATRALVRMWYIIGFAFTVLTSFVWKKNGMFQGGNYVVRREALLKIGGHDTSIAFYGDDVDTGVRLLALGKIKWSFGFSIYASGRRVEKKGIWKMGYIYAASYISVTFFRKPFTQDYDDVRPTLTQ
jgi:cellulose synthase/poly-beta-1,6-N-acetylglucosamine synthase-like glycosyltransferase